MLRFRSSVGPVGDFLDVIKVQHTAVSNARGPEGLDDRGNAGEGLKQKRDLLNRKYVYLAHLSLALFP